MTATEPLEAYALEAIGIPWIDQAAVPRALADVQTPVLVQAMHEAGQTFAARTGEFQRRCGFMLWELRGRLDGDAFAAVVDDFCRLTGYAPRTLRSWRQRVEGAYGLRTPPAAALKGRGAAAAALVQQARRLGVEVRPDKRYVYVLRSGTSCKIGWSSEPSSRFNALAASSPAPMELVAIGVGGPEKEAELHQVFASKRRRGEWYDLEPADVDECRRRLDAAPSRPARSSSPAPTGSAAGQRVSPPPSPPPPAPPAPATHRERPRVPLAPEPPPAGSPQPGVSQLDLLERHEVTPRFKGATGGRRTAGGSATEVLAAALAPWVEADSLLEAAGAGVEALRQAGLL